jgi:hypothetical protein
MRDWKAGVATLRTTSNAAGRARCIVTGIGATPELALVELRKAAEKEAQRAGERVAQAAEAREAHEANVMRETEAQQERAEEDRFQEEVRRWEERLERYYREHPGTRGTGVPVHAVGPRPTRAANRNKRDDEPRDAGPREYWFEVIDVRLTPAPGKGGGRGWLAYGTLAWEGSPRQVTTTGSGSGSHAADPADVGHRDNRGDRSRKDRGTR